MATIPQFIILLLEVQGSTGRRLLLNVDSFETGASFPTTLDLRDAPQNKSILATIK
jgi:hypothetical protein